MVNNQNVDSFAITSAWYDALHAGDLIEIAEFHSHGFLIEVVAVSVRTDIGDFHGITVVAGDIEGNFAPRETYNVTCIGGFFERVGDQRYFAFPYADDEAATRNDVLRFCAQLLIDRELTPICV